jgi:hypothetical protein
MALGGTVRLGGRPTSSCRKTARPAFANRIGGAIRAPRQMNILRPFFGGIESHDPDRILTLTFQQIGDDSFQIRWSRL